MLNNQTRFITHCWRTSGPQLKRLGNAIHWITYNPAESIVCSHLAILACWIEFYPQQWTALFTLLQLGLDNLVRHLHIYPLQYSL